MNFNNPQTTRNREKKDKFFDKKKKDNKIKLFNNTSISKSYKNYDLSKKK